MDPVRSPLVRFVLALLLTVCPLLGQAETIPATPTDNGPVDSFAGGYYAWPGASDPTGNPASGPYADSFGACNAVGGNYGYQGYAGKLTWHGQENTSGSRCLSNSTTTAGYGLLYTGGTYCTVGSVVDGRCVSYSCPSGYTVTGSNCVRPDTACSSVSGQTAGPQTWRGTLNTSLCFPNESAGNCKLQITGDAICTGSDCYATQTRWTGEVCSPPQTPPVMIPGDADPQCNVTDVWCNLPSTGCPAGMVRAQVGETPICVQSGSGVSTGTATTPATPTYTPGAGEAGPGGGRSTGTINPAPDPTGGNTGGGVSVQFPEIKDPCGIPGGAPCKIDETGTPDGTGFDDAAKSVQAQADAAHQSFMDSIMSTSGKDTDIGGFQSALPIGAGCTDLALAFPGIGVVSIGPCTFAPEISAVVSAVWFVFGFWACYGIITRALHGGS